MEFPTACRKSPACAIHLRQSACGRVDSLRSTRSGEWGVKASGWFPSTKAYLRVPHLPFFPCFFDSLQQKAPPSGGAFCCFPHPFSCGLLRQRLFIPYPAVSANYLSGFFPSGSLQNRKNRCDFVRKNACLVRLKSLFCEKTAGYFR